MKKILFLTLTIGISVILFTVGYFLIVQKPSVPPKKTETLKKSQFSIENPPTESLSGKIASMSGAVEWQSRIATQSVLIKNLIPIHQGEDVITKEKGKATVLFPNACTLELSEKTTVNIIQTLPQNFVFSQTSGKIHYTKDGSIPLSIRSLHLIVQVNSGEITLTVDKDQPLITLTVINGSTTVAYNSLANISTVLSLSAGQKFIFNDQTRKNTLTSL